MTNNHNVHPIRPIDHNKSWFERFKEDRHFSWPVSLALSALATTATAVAIHGPNYGKKTFMHHAQTALTWEPSYEYQQILSTNHKTKGGYLNRVHPAGPIGHTRLTIHSPAEVWARNFAQDPHAGELVDPHALNDVEEQLDKIAEAGNRIYSVEVSGFASAEDDQPDGGLQKPSAKNAQLALRRADVIATHLLDDIDSHSFLRKAMVNDEIKQGRIVEQSLTDAQVHHLEDLARNDGFRKPIDLINAWNLSPNSVNHIDALYLQHLLGDARKTEIDVSWGRPHQKLYERDVYCARYLITALQTQQIKEKDSVPLPIPIFIPWWVKRREGEEGDDENKDSGDGDDTYQRRRFLGAGIGGWALRGALVAAVLFNASGENCHQGHHGPRPIFPIDMIWEAFDDATGRGADVQQTISFGIPFVSEAQVNLFNVQPNLWGIPGERTCELPPKKTIQKFGNKCLVVAVRQVNGKTVSRTVLNQAQPVKTTTVTQP